MQALESDVSFRFVSVGTTSPLGIQLWGGGGRDYPCAKKLDYNILYSNNNNKHFLLQPR